MTPDEYLKISTWTLEQFQFSLIYGVAILILYIVIPTALLANELRLATLNGYMGGNHSIFTHVFKAVFFIVMWVLFVSLIAILLIGSAGHTKLSPAFGVWSFFNIDWLDSNTMSSLGNGSTVYKEGGDKELQEAKYIVLMMAWAKFVEIVMLGMMLALTLGLLFGAKISKIKRNNEEMDFGTAAIILALALLGFGMFNLEIRMIDIFLTDLIHWGNTFSSANLHPEKVDIYKDFWSFLRRGLDIAINKK